MSCASPLRPFSSLKQCSLMETLTWMAMHSWTRCSRHTSRTPLSSTSPRHRRATSSAQKRTAHSASTLGMGPPASASASMEICSQSPTSARAHHPPVHHPPSPERRERAHRLFDQLVRNLRSNRFSDSH